MGLTEACVGTAIRVQNQLPIKVVETPPLESFEFALENTHWNIP